MKMAKHLLIWMGLLVAVFSAGCRSGPEASTPEKQARGAESTLAEPVGGEVSYICPMVCIPPRSKPGRCPVCGMDLVPYDLGNTADSAKPVLVLSPAAVRLAAIETAVVRRRVASARIRLYGKIDYDPAHVTKISVFTPGVIDRVYVKRTGQFIRWGEPLFDVYSDDLLNTQEQLIEAMNYVPSFFAFQSGTPHTARDLPVQKRVDTESTENSPEVEKALAIIDGIRHKLSILGLPKRDIDEMMKKGEATGISTVYSSVYGQVIEQNAFEGAFVNTGTPIFTLADPKYVWVKLEAYEMDYPWLRKGQVVTFETSAYPGEMFRATIVNIDPVFNSQTRTFSLGAVCDENDGQLKAGMVVRAEVHALLDSQGVVVDPESDVEAEGALEIPATAPLITGRRAIVYVADPIGEGRFEGREVTLGPRTEDGYVVLSGLGEGERVVKNGNFKIDSTLQIHARPGMLSLEDGQSARAYQSPGGSDVLARDYQQHRMESRREVMEEFTSGKSEQEVEPPGRKDSPGARTIQRRRPGNYGDTTR